MTRTLYWLGIFLLSAVVSHLAYVLFAPRQAASAMILQVQQRMGANNFHLLTGPLLRRFVRHPLPEATYGACLLDLQDAPVALKGMDLRTQWALTVYAPRGDVIYAITDRHVPAGSLDVRFEYRGMGEGEIALPKLQGKTMVVPLSVKQALVLLEAWPWHPGQAPLLARRIRALTCTAMPGTPRAKAPSSASAETAVPVPRTRPTQERALSPRVWSQ